MKQREDSILELVVRVKAADMGLAFLKRTPTTMPGSGQYPALFILEGDDAVMEQGKRAWSGYPCKRKIEVTFELWASDTADIKNTLFEALRKAIFQAPLTTGAGMYEARTFGPFNSGIPGVIAMQLVLVIQYKDNGPN